MSKSSGAVFASTFLLAFGLDTPAWAYLDAGSGSLLLQLILGGVSGVLVVAKLYWSQLKDFFSHRKPPHN